jgi:hypothetical protein
MTEYFEKVLEKSVKAYGAADIEEMPVLKHLTKECYQDLDETTAQEIRSSLLKPESNPILENPDQFQPSLPAHLL